MADYQLMVALYMLFLYSDDGSHFKRNKLYIIKLYVLSLILSEILFLSLLPPIIST